MCARSTKATAQVFFSGEEGRFNRKFDEGHEEIFRALDDPSIKKVAILAPRGIGKTSITNLAFPARNIWFQLCKYIVSVSCSSTSAKAQAENLKQHLLGNMMANKLFGPVKSDNFNQDQWVTSSGICVMPRGAGQQVRGLLYENWRPDLITVDDLEDPENMPNEDQRRKINEWVFGSLLPCVDLGRDQYKIVIVGTLLHEDCTVAKLQKDESFHRIRLELCDDNYESKWPNYIPTLRVKEMAEAYRQRGMISTFFREYRNKAIATEECPFSEEFFQYYEEADLRMSKTLETVVIVDVAKTTTVKSDYSAIVGVGVDHSVGAFFVRDLVMKRLHPEEIYSTAFEMAKTLNASVVGFEVTSLNEFITWPIANYCLQHNISTPWIELKARGKKEDRIAQLVPLYRQQLVFHNKNVTSPLEAQLLSFPRSEHDDAMDALAYIIEMMDLGGRHIIPRNSPSGMGVGDAEEEELKRMREEDLREAEEYRLEI
jgi:predicted phage terminase large subunit-like protein